MLVAAIKRWIPLSVKVKLKSMLITPEPPRVKSKKTSSKLRLRPCAQSWPHSVCECDMQLGEFKRQRIRKKLLHLMGDAEIEWADNVGVGPDHLAIDIAEVPRLKELLDAGGFKYEVVARDTQVNEYDFPLTKDGGSFSESVSPLHYEIRVQPLYFCAARRQDANALSILVTTFNDVNGVRLFHSRLAAVRTRAIGSGRVETGSGGNLSSDPIDVVITTVDGSDPVWREKFDAMLSARTGVPVLAKTANSARYTNHDELRYVLRSIYYYAPYVRNIYIVTDNQCPAWLDAGHPQVHIVDHREIIDPEYLPTFNSDAIESCLWKIPGLSERFIYFNDDVVLMAPTSETTFFTSNGIPRFFASPRRIPDMPSSWAESYTMHAHLESSLALEKRGYGRPLTKYRHVPFVARKSILRAMEEEFSEELAQTRSSPVRSEKSFATISFLYPNYALATRGGVLSQIKYEYIDISWPDWRGRLVRACQRTDVAVACINESHDALDDGSLDKELSGILSSRFPVVAPWERDSFRENQRRP